jgi:hypothetical protein
MKLFLIVCLVVAAAAPARAQRRPPDQVIRDDGSLLLTDGSSFYRFNRDSSFDSGPLGLSGRTITGRWRLDGSSGFIIEGKWSWINGLALTDDFRRMTLRIGNVESPTNTDTLVLSGRRGPARVHRGYWFVESIVSLPPPAIPGGRGAAARSSANFLIRFELNNAPGVEQVAWRVEDTRGCYLEIQYRDTWSPATLPPSQVWLLRSDGTAVPRTRPVVMTGGGFGGTGPSYASYYYDCAAQPDAATVVVKLGQEFFVKPVLR